jgi:hypothetical protein
VTLFSTILTPVRSVFPKRFLRQRADCFLQQVRLEKCALATRLLRHRCHQAARASVDHRNTNYLPTRGVARQPVSLFSYL